MLRGTMSSFRRSASFATSVAFLALLVPLAAGGAGAASDPPDPLAAELERWLTITQTRQETEPFWAQSKPGRQAALERARENLRNGRRLLALQTFSDVRADLAAAIYLLDRTADERKDMAAFDAAWKRVEGELGTTMPASTALDGQSALVRALGEAALSQIRVYHQASLDYGHNTSPGAGFLYLGTALAQRDLIAFYRTLPAPAPRRTAPPLRSLRPELDALQAEMLSIYRPPVSIDRHSEFVVASAALKEARELDAAGLRYGALLRYLRAAHRFAAVRPASSAPRLDAEALAGRLRDLEKRLESGGVDHGIGQLFLEAAQAEVAKSEPGSVSFTAVDLAADVLPRYFAALEPARPQPPKPEPQVTVTLVRWPYT